jgi:hypothetical protein
MSKEEKLFQEAKFLYTIPPNIARMIRREVKGVECLINDEGSFTVKKAPDIW